MTWTTPKDCKDQLMRLWERGELLRDMAVGTTRFPLQLRYRGPNSTDVTERFAEVRAWASGWTSAGPIRVEWQEVRHRVQGTQRLPGSLWVDTVDEALRWIGKRKDAERFAALIAATKQNHPELLPWLVRRPLQGLALADDWPRLLAIVAWLLAHPRPGMYLRQMDVPGVHTKFVESHRATLAELLDLALPPAGVDADKSGAAQFAARYGFVDRPVRLRFRPLDPALSPLPGVPNPDITLDADSFAGLQLQVQQVLVTENETNFLALPHLPGTLAIWGAGYGWEALARARWLAECAIWYWGDIDTHGFAILDQLRGVLPHAKSLLMDRETLLAHRELWGQEAKPAHAALQRLVSDEVRLYDDLRDNRLGSNVRLEQEHIGFAWVRERLAGLGRS